MTMTAKLPFAAIALALSLSGCVSFGPKAPATLLSLTPQSAPAVGAGASGSYANALVVLEPSAEARLAVLRVPVQIDDANVAYLQKTLWVERPARLFQRLLAETLRARGNRLVIESDTGTGGLHLAGRLLDMGFDARSASAVIRYDAIKELPGGKVETRRFESIVPNVEADAKSVGPALNQAANDVAKQVADWVG
jgi:cholesterol transport system auxiliary component